MSVASEFVDIYAPYMRQKQMSKQRMQQMQMMDQLTRGRIKEQQRFEAMQNSVEYARQWDKEREDRQRAEELMGRQWKREDRVREDEQEHEIEKAKIYTSRYGRGSSPTETDWWGMSKFYTERAIDLMTSRDPLLISLGKQMYERAEDARLRAMYGDDYEKKPRKKREDAPSKKPKTLKDNIIEYNRRKKQKPKEDPLGLF